MTLAFHTANRRVYASDGVYCEAMSDDQVERQLDLLQELGLKRQFHQLYDAHIENGGVPRCLVGRGLAGVKTASRSLPGCAPKSATSGAEPSAAGA